MKSAERTAFSVASGEGDPIYMMNALMTTKVRAEDSGGAFALCEFYFDRNALPPPHIHHGEDEAWYVLEGELTFYVGDRSFDARPGSFVYAPRDVAHHFELHTEHGRILTFLTPGGFEGFFHAMGEPTTSRALPAPSAPDFARLTELFEQYRCELSSPAQAQ